MTAVWVFGITSGTHTSCEWLDVQPRGNRLNLESVDMFWVEDGTISQVLIDYWVTRAKGGWGLLIVEFTAVDPLGKVGPCHPGIWSDGKNPGVLRHWGRPCSAAGDSRYRGGHYDWSCNLAMNRW